jgi:hypothetical protein
LLSSQLLLLLSSVFSSSCLHLSSSVCALLPSLPFAFFSALLVCFTCLLFLCSLLCSPLSSLLSPLHPACTFNPPCALSSRCTSPTHACLPQQCYNSVTTV